MEENTVSSLLQGIIKQAVYKLKQWEKTALNSYLSGDFYTFHPIFP